MSTIGGIGGSSNAWASQSNGRALSPSPTFTTSDTVSNKGIDAAPTGVPVQELGTKNNVSLDKHLGASADMDFDEEDEISSEEMFESVASEGTSLPSTMEFAQARGMEPVAASVTVITQAIYASPEGDEQGAGKNKLSESA